MVREPAVKNFPDEPHLRSEASLMRCGDRNHAEPEFLAGTATLLAREMESSLAREMESSEMHPQSSMKARRPVFQRDARGLIITAGDAGGVAAIDAFADTVLRRRQGAHAILDQAAAQPDCPMLQACAAACHLLADTRHGIERALPLLDAAGRRLAAATDREAMLVAALGAIARGRPRLADGLFFALAETAPQDLLAGYIGHLHFLNHGRFDAMLAHARRLHRASPSDP